jgi:hypothetical protein
LLGLGERERLDSRPDGVPLEQREHLVPVAPGEVRDRADAALAPEQLVRERRDVRHVDPGADDSPTLRERV